MIMATDVTLFSDRALERQHGREQQGVLRRTERTELEVGCLAGVTQRAIYRAAELNMVRAQAERIAPDGAEHYALLAGVGVTEMALAISRMSRGW